MASPPTKKLRTVARQEQRFVQQLASGIQTQTARQKSENIDYVLKTLQDHPDDSLAEAVAKMLRNGCLQRAAAASTRDEFSPWGKELSLSVKKFKHIPATMCAAILRKLEPGAYSDISWDEPPLNNAAVLRQRVVFAICASEEDTLPTQHLCFRFEKGLLEYCLARYTQAGSRLKTLAPTAPVVYYELSGNTVKVLAPLMDETATKIVQLAGLDSATDWVIENNISCKAELVSAQMGERKALANKFIDINSGKTCFHPDGDQMNIRDPDLPEWCLAKEPPKGVRSLFWVAKEQAAEAKAKALAKAKAKAEGAAVNSKPQRRRGTT